MLGFGGGGTSVIGGARGAAPLDGVGGGRWVSTHESLDTLLKIRGGDYDLTRRQVKLKMGMTMNNQEHIRV
jgi:hypothetical protein